MILLCVLQFIQGDLVSFFDVKSQFMMVGWVEFMKKLEGWQDEKGVVMFSFWFVLFGFVLDVWWYDGVIDLIIFGVLEQESCNVYGGVLFMRYCVEIDVQFDEGL